MRFDRANAVTFSSMSDLRRIARNHADADMPAHIVIIFSSDSLFKLYRSGSSMRRNNIKMFLARMPAQVKFDITRTAILAKLRRL